MVGGESKQMFGLSTELITKGKLATEKRDSNADVLSVSPASPERNVGSFYQTIAYSP